jgi:dienelactone hydrolase
MAYMLGLPVLTAQTHELTVVDGSGGGAYAPGASVTVFARAFSREEYFDRWEGDTQVLTEPENWRTSFAMPPQAVHLSAVFRTNQFPWVYEEIAGVEIPKPVYYALPPIRVGVIWFLHGSNGSAESLFNGVEAGHFARKALSAGYGVIITEAEESTLRFDTDGDGALRWVAHQYHTNNVDIANVLRLAENLAARGLLETNETQMAVGVSNGGAFAQTLAAVLDFSVAVSYVGAGRSALYDGKTPDTDCPTLWIMAENDSNDSVGPEGNARALSHYTSLAVRVESAAFLWHRRYPLHPDRFMRCGLSEADSRAAHQELLTNGLLDSDYLPATNSAGMFAIIAAAPSSFPFVTGLATQDLPNLDRQIDIPFADHAFMDDWNGTVLRYLRLAGRPLAPVLGFDGAGSEPCWTWTGHPNYRYGVETNGDLAGPAWQSMAGWTHLQGSGFCLPVRLSADSVFLRLSAQRCAP